MILEDVEYLKELENEIDKGNVDAMVQWASYYTVMHPEIECKDELLNKVLTYYFKGTQAEHPVAYLNLGAMYYNGTGRPKDLGKAFVLYKKAAELHNVQAMCNVGYCYYYGNGVPADLSKAYHWFLKGALSGNDANCYYKLHEMYAEGEFVIKDEEMSFIMLTKCFENIKEEEADLVYAASKRLGRCLMEGKGCKKDLIEAMSIFHAAQMNLASRVQLKDEYAKAALQSIEKDLNELKEELLK